ncbi:hypothetical protein AJ78_09060, partial [Emergomyces pasteurianus Ep9510]
MAEYHSHFPYNLEIALPNQFDEVLPQLTAQSHEQEDKKNDQDQDAEQDQQGEQNHPGEKSAEIVAAQWMCWVKMMVPDTNIQWYVTDNRNKIYKFYVNYE